MSNNDWISPVDRARIGFQDPLSRLNALEVLANGLKVSTNGPQTASEMNPDMGIFSAGALYFGTGDISDLTTLPTGLFIDAVGVHIFNAGAEVGRFGDLIGFLSYVTDTFGIGIGAANGYLTYDPVNGLRVKGSIQSFGVNPLGFDVWMETPSGTVNGSNTSFNLANAPASGTVQAFLNGLWLYGGGGGDYTVSTPSNFTMNIAPQTGDVMRADYVRLSDLSIIYGETPTGTINGVNTAFNTASAHKPGSIQVYINGITYIYLNDYTDGVGSIAYTSAPQTGDLIRVAYMLVSDPKLITQELLTGAVNGSNKVFTFANNYISTTEHVIINGMLQTLGADYTETGANQITFTTAPSTGDLLWSTYRSQ